MKKIFALSIVIMLAINLFPQVHTTYLWHLQQPIYWPENSQWNVPKYQYVWESHHLKTNGGNIYPDGQAHPLNDLEEIFGKDDRKAVYQYRTKDAVQTLLGFPEAGAQVNYSGVLIENVNSLASAGQWGYSNGWQNNFVTARNWQTSGGKPRMDIVGFTFHHVIAPLVSENVLRKEIQAHRYIYGQTFGASPNYSEGFWPAECSFSERIIKVLAVEGLDWSVIANSHLARTLSDYPLTFGTSGCNMEPPNGADKVTTIGSNWWSGQIDGRGGTFAAPYCYQAHKAQYVDPETGEIFKITVVPMDDVLSYMNGYALMGTGEIDSHIAPFDDPAHPSMVLLAHDGDNAWGGGYDYYQNSVPQFAQACANQGYVPSTIQQFLTNHPAPENDVVHVEDGSWVNAANDWGHPQFINWNWPLYTTDHEFNPDGWTEDVRNWAVLVAAENRVQMAEDLTAPPPIADIVSPSNSSSLTAKAWHHLLPGFASCYMYYGASLDMEVKQTLACNSACDFADQVISANPGEDVTPPTVFIPQRFPYNPGGIGFGPVYSYQQHQNSSDFYVWTLAYDVSGLQNVVLKYRVDDDGVNTILDITNDTYSGGTGVGQWQSLVMDSRMFPAGNVTNNPDINFFIMPDYIAYHYYAEITGISEKLVDYYIEATDTYGNVFKTPIQHVYVGEASPGGQGNVTWTPEEPDNNSIITIVIENATQGGKLHWGVNGFYTPIEDYWPEGTFIFNGTGPAVETPFAGPNAGNQLILQIGPFNNPAQEVTKIGFVIHYNDDTWDNNNGQDYFINIGAGGTEIVQWLPATPNQTQTITITVNQAAVGGKLHWGVNGWNSPNQVYWPAGSYLFGGSGPAVQTPMTGPNASNQLTLQIGPFNNPAQEVTVVDFVINYNDGTWNNNNGQDYHITINEAVTTGNLQGAVKSLASSYFIEGASITLSDGSHLYATTSGSGFAPDLNYQIEGIASGTYTVECMAQGYETSVLSNVEITEGTNVLNFDLNPLTYPLPEGWEFNMNPASHNVLIPLNANPQVNNQPLQNGDYVGLFYTDNNEAEKCGGAIQWPADTVMVAAFGDDAFTPEKDGFISNDPLIWKIFRQSEQQAYYAQVTYDSTKPNYDGTFQAFGLSQLTSLEAWSSTTQIIDVPAGWSGISTFIDPLNDDVENIFEPFLDNFIILINTYQVYYPSQGVHTLENWDFQHGYKVKTETGFTLNIPGFYPTNLTLNLDSGWTLVPVLSECGAQAAELFQGITALRVVKEIAGTRVFWPAFGIQTLQTLEPGKAYYVSLLESASITFPACDDKFFKSQNKSLTILPPSWNEPVKTPSSHLIVIPTTVFSQAGFEIGDIMGTFTQEGTCAGILTIESFVQNAALVIFADDETTLGIKEGFSSDDGIFLKTYRPSLNLEATVETEFEPGMPENGFFKDNGLSAIKNAEVGTFGMNENEKNQIYIFPNPSIGEFTLTFNNMTEEVSIELSGLKGNVLDKKIIDQQPPNNELTLSYPGLSKGIYFLKITSQTKVQVQKIMVQ